MGDKLKMTPAEWEIMEAVWQLDRPVAVRDVLEHLFPNGEKAYTTVQTMLNILERKKMLTRQKIGLVNFYSPTRSRDEVSSSETRSLVRRVFGGSVPALANSLLDLDGVGLSELQQIKKLLAEKESELRGKKK
jgi:BlaI family penicillinase repressor